MLWPVLTMHACALQVYAIDIVISTGEGKVCSCAKGGIGGLADLGGLSIL